MERLQKVIAHGGIASRRKAEELILAGKVKVNGITVKELGIKINPRTDLVEIEGTKIQAMVKPVYYMLNKPRGYVTTARDQFNRLTVLDLLKDVKCRVYPVGRLDYETEGLLLLTNDGELAFKLTHPKNKVDKVYEVLVDGNVSKATLQLLANGVMLDDGKTLPAKAKTLKSWPHQTLVELTIREGRNRQVRKMMAAAGHRVKQLKRTKIDFLELNDLKQGQYRSLTLAEIERLKSL
ncbi:MAG: rRNA pseudouridine synthase [Clostridia bacterium]|nr:rRNA pseudouridine synthase [Clostridia bacterium]